MQHAAPSGGSEKMVGRILVRMLLTAPLPLTALIYLPILTRTLSKAQYGQWGMAMATAAGVSAMATLGLAIAVPRFFARDQERGSFAAQFWACLMGCLLLNVLLLAACLPFAEGIGELIFSQGGMAAPALACLALGVLLSFRILLSSLLRARLELVFQSWLEALVMGVRMGVVCVMAPAGASVAQMLGGLALVEAAACLYLLWVAWLRAPLRHARLVLPRGYLRYALPLLPAVALNWLGAFAERYVLVHVSGPAVVGDYTVAITTAAVITTLAGPVTFVLLPQLAQAWAGEDGRGQAGYLFATANRMLLLLGAPAVLGLAMVWSELAPLLAGSSFDSSWPLIALTAGGKLFYAVYLANIYAWHLSLRTGRILLVLALGSGVNLALALLLAPRLGATGAAAAFAGGQAVCALLAMAVSRRLCGWRLPLAFCVKLTLACLAMAGVLALMKWQAWGGLIALICAGALTYGGAVLALRVVSREEARRVFGGMMGR